MRRCKVWRAKSDAELAASGRARPELEERSKFLFQRSRTQSGRSRMTKTQLEDEFIRKGFIGERPHAKGSGFPTLCPPRGNRGDIAWKLYEKKYPERVPFIKDPVASESSGPSASRQTNASPAPAAAAAMASGSASPGGAAAVQSSATEMQRSSTTKRGCGRSWETCKECGETKYKHWTQATCDECRSDAPTPVRPPAFMPLDPPPAAPAPAPASARPPPRSRAPAPTRARPANSASESPHKRPRGRAPKGKEWDEINGAWKDMS